MNFYRSATNNEVSPKLEIRNHLRNEGVILSRELIGNGTYSTVRIGMSQRLGKRVAVKLIDIRTNSEYVQRFMPRELQLIPTLNHPNIVKVYQIIQTTSFVAIVEEYGENGDVLKLVKKLGHIDEIEGRFLFRQLVEALKYLERLDIVHRDLKCENIFLDRHTNIKLGDFGFARVLSSPESSNTHCGSKAYVAVELLRGKTYTGNAGDIWSAGVVLFIMLTGKMPYNDRNTREMIDTQMRHRVIFPDGMVSPDARDLIRHMLHPRRELRANTKDILASRWMNGCRYFMRGEVNEERSCSTASSTSITEKTSDKSVSSRTVAENSET